FNGWYNNRANPALGVPDSSITRRLPAHYSDGVFLPSGLERPNVRSISNTIMAGPSGLPSQNNKTALFLYFGEHVMQDILDTTRPGCPPEYFNVQLNNDATFDVSEMPYERSRYQTSNSGYSPNHPREQVNEVTSYLDGSQIYGHTKAWSDNLRLLKKTCAGRTTTSNLFSSQVFREFPALNDIGLPLDNSFTTKDNVIGSGKRFYRLGARNGNENPFVLTIGVTWFRHHNWLAHVIRDLHPDWTDDDVFNEARIENIATYQSIVLYEWLPILLGTCTPTNSTKCFNVKPYTGYSSSASVGISDIFEGTARHYLHTLTPPGVFARGTTGSCTFRNITSALNGGSTTPALRLCNSFWDPAVSKLLISVEELTMGMASQIAELEDNIITEDLRNHFYGTREFSRRDFVAILLQKGRDHGLPDYNVAREDFGLNLKSTFNDINNALFQSNMQDNGTLLRDLEALHTGDLSKLDILTGGILETTGGNPGELFRYVIADQFDRLRNGDRFWFENTKTNLLNASKISEILNTKFRDVIFRVNPTLNKSLDLQDNPFMWNTNGYKLFCPQPYQLNENVLEECTPLQRYDYFKSSEVSFPVSFAFFGVFVLVTILFMHWLGHRRTKSAQNEKRKITTNKRQATLVASGNMTIATEVLGENVRQIQIIFGPENTIQTKLATRKKTLRTIELKRERKIEIINSNGTDRRTMIVRVEGETYDLVLSFGDMSELDHFYNELNTFLKSSRLHSEHHLIPEKHIMEDARTKEKRDEDLQQFFRAALSQAANIRTDGDGINRHSVKELVNVTINKSELAEYLKLKEDSVFVERMFTVADANEDGVVSFREFLDIIVLFTKGTPQEKAKMMFSMYDLDKSGGLSVSEFKTMLKSMIEIVESSPGSDQLDVDVERMMQENGFSNKDSLTLDDFQILLGQCSSGGNGSAMHSGGLVCSLYASYYILETGDSYCLSYSVGHLYIHLHSVLTTDTFIMSMNKPVISMFVPSTPMARRMTRRVKTLRDDYKTKPHEKFLLALVKLNQHYANHIFCLALYCTITAGVFANAFFVVYSKNSSGLFGIGGSLMAIARASAAALMFNFSTLLLTMCRNIITFLRETFLHRYIPFDSAVTMHRIIAWMAITFTALHIVAHGINFYSIVTQSPDDMACLFRDMWYPSDYVPTFVFWLFQTITGITGVILTLALIIMYVFASNYSRRLIFTWFRWTHKVGYMSLYFFTVLHGSGMLIIGFSPQFYYYFLVPAILFALDKVYTYSRKKAYISVVRAELYPSEVTHLEFKRPKNFDYKAGQWVRIACLAQSPTEYHPFTLSSAPHEDTLMLHIRAVGPWTRNLRKIYDPNVLRDSPYPKLYLDGPFGEGHQDWYKYEVSVLVGGGIGVTPFASILKDLINRSQTGGGITCKAVYFIWVTRDQKQYEWLTDIIQDVESKDAKQILNTHIFITQFPQKFDLRTTMLYICEENFQKISGKSLFTGLRAVTHFGRPDFTDFFATLGEEHPSVENFGVFSCGPAPMTKGVENACSSLNKYTGPTYSHHFENF
uniref:NAD(P)H oxidase (H2O2-forming) n=1 Tax=Ciona savignyi TaxID=51511 RepID=H2ZL35_CIOSA